jgi:hypothetical protein
MGAGIKPLFVRLFWEFNERYEVQALDLGDGANLILDRWPQAARPLQLSDWLGNTFCPESPDNVGPAVALM